MKTKTVLIIDDDSSLQDMLRAVVEEAGFAAITVGDGADAFSLAAQDIDLILLDLVMPLAAVDGFAFLSQARAWPKLANTPIIVVSGLGEPVANVMDAATANALRVVSVMSKPVDVPVLLSTMRAVLDADRSP